MSLLMDALRKAEEAKKLAAKQASVDTKSDSSAATKAAPVVEEPIVEELLFDTEEFSSEPEVITPSADVEVPFEFEIDESFGIDFDAPVAEKAESSQESSSETKQADLNSEVEEPDTERSVEFETSGFSLVEPELQEEKEAEQKLEIEEGTTASEVTSTLSLVEDREPPVTQAELKSEMGLESRIEPGTQVEPKNQVKLEDSDHTEEAQYLQKADIEKFVPRTNTNESEKNRPTETSSLQSTLTPPPAPKPEAEPVARSPMRALRDEANSAAEAKRNGESQERKAGAALESRKRESARAVFNAKSRGGENRGRKIAIAAACVLIPLAGLSFWVLDPLGMFSSGSQYNVPVASYDPNRTFDEVIEPGALAAGDESLPDVSESLQAVEIAQIAAPEEPPASNIDLPTTIEPASLVAQEQPVAALQGNAVEAVPAPAIATETAPTSAAANMPPVAPVDRGNAVADVANETLPSVVDNAAPEAAVASRTEEAATRANTPINIVRSDGPQLDPQLSLAFNAYRGNDLVGARAHYQQALRNLPNNRDALLGLAAVSLKMGDATSARAHYTKLLELDPRDALARVGLLGTVPASDPTSLESELRGLFNDHPEVAQLAFALGNLQASQGRWTEAQQSYYDALLAAKAGGSGPITPDYAFNLAVSLERLNQLRSAYGFYREALAQSEIIPPNFDVRILRERLDALERVLP